MRHQLTLNMARDDVRDWAIDWLDRLIDDYQLDYVKLGYEPLSHRGRRPGPKQAGPTSAA